MQRIDSPRALASAISSRSANDKQRPFRSRPRRGRTPPAARTHPARGGHPPRALLAVGPSLSGRVDDELAALQRGPEQLNSLRNHSVTKHGHQQHSSRQVLRSPREPKVRLTGAGGLPPTESSTRGSRLRFRGSGSLQEPIEANAALLLLARGAGLSRPRRCSAAPAERVGYPTARGRCGRRRWLDARSREATAAQSRAAQECSSQGRLKVVACVRPSLDV